LELAHFREGLGAAAKDCSATHHGSPSLSSFRFGETPHDSIQDP